MLLTIPQVALALCVSRHSVYRMIRNGDLPAVQLPTDGGMFRVRREDLDSFIKHLPYYRSASNKRAKGDMKVRLLH